ncbi:protein TIFY 8 [Malania oleifera]|uniref:protein TIFY 8 n=1 Tax=Malania oleifera TaxID=397392 RepID=UPI0025AE04EC|nr:protein TIFY 8 [Malania oleifera]XP_057959355.1 protein TIFY 8 [Malania oleifera]
MAVLPMAMMAQSKSNVNTSAEVNPVFHDFLGMSCASDAPVAAPPKTAGCGADFRLSEASPSASASVGVSSGAGRGPISTTSDLGSERQVGNHLEGVPFYGLRSDLSGHEVSNRFTGSKRSNSDSTFMGSSRDGFPQMASDSLESSHLMKMLKNGAGGERPRRSADEELLFSVQPLRPTSASLILQPPTCGRSDANLSKWERSAALNVGPTTQYPPRTSHFAPFVHQVPSNRFRDANAGPSIISRSAADEGSRTGIKGSGILSSIKACTGASVSASASERNLSVLPASGSRPKPGTHASEPESSTPPIRHGLTSVSRQMTIFYGGQAHVFDDVHPNKADVIMALAGSNGGSWSTTYSPKPSAKPVNESYLPNGENELAMTSNAYSQEFRGRFTVTGNSGPGTGPGDRITAPAGHRSGAVTRDSRTPAQAREPVTEEKR